MWSFSLSPIVARPPLKPARRRVSSLGSPSPGCYRLRHQSHSKGGRGGGTMASWPPAPSTIAMVTTTGHGRSSPHRPRWLQSLTAADTCADVRVFVGRRLLPAGPPAEERMGGREGVSDPASRASGSAQARRAGSLTPRVSVQIVRTDAARIASRSAAGCVHRFRIHDRAGRRARD